MSPDAPTNPVLYWVGHVDEDGLEFRLEGAKGPFRLDLGDILYAPNVLQDDTVRAGGSCLFVCVCVRVCACVRAREEWSACELSKRVGVGVGWGQGGWWRAVGSVVVGGCWCGSYVCLGQMDRRGATSGWLRFSFAALCLL